ncbi:related to DFG10 protein [Cephalotrichum gorgonifer]|uniref:Polyprenal reductase n=1 Tax=Cephalotrichum gorgonifer TaxID=2041049 RepID=A0AAE8MXE3_9PEZI|nr:related to DFG10 protein [Cephalotrichum gorgonifer]
MPPYIPPLLLPLSLPPSTYCQSYFILLASGCLALQLLPALQDVLLNYGPRNSSPAAKPAPREPETADNTRDALLRPLVVLLRRTGLLTRVPHAWFSHFYLALLVFQIFWAAQYLTGGRVLSAIAGMEMESGKGEGGGMSLGQVVLAWGMLTAQAARRLYECWFVMRPSASQMLGLHWVLSVLVYLAMSVSVWIEGSAAILGVTSAEEGNTISPLRTAVAAGIFIVASAQQHRAHKHLASLRKYTLPYDGLFRYIVCAHYTCECLIYVALAGAAAPRGHLLNRTLLSGLFFVAANLGATAKNTKVWYVEKFGAERVQRWRMIPFLF